MKKFAVLLTIILSLTLLFCSCAAGSSEGTTAPETTSQTPVFEENITETESVFAQNETSAEAAETTSSADEASTFSVG